MRQPLWAINSSFLLFFILGQIVLFMLYSPVPRRISLEPDTFHAPEKKTGVIVTIKNIYEQNDLFNTYVPVVAALPKVDQGPIPEIPASPAPIQFTIPLEKEKVFIAPLAVNLKGVMYSYDKPENSVAIIQFQNSKEEINYKVGQLVIDAQILKIYPNRVIVVRPNGQQETLFLREQEANKDKFVETQKEIATLHVQLKNGVYHVPVDVLTRYVKSLGQFIDMLDLMTVYQRGKSIGCKVGKAGKDSLASKLGFIKEDIIEHIDELPITDIASRIVAFDYVLAKNIDDTISVTLDRGGQKVILKYMLVHSTSQTALQPTIPPVQVAKNTAAVNQEILDTIDEQRKKILEQKVKLAPTAYELQMQERRKMFEVRRKEMMENASASRAELALHNNVESGSKSFESNNLVLSKVRG